MQKNRRQHLLSENIKEEEKEEEEVWNASYREEDPIAVRKQDIIYNLVMHVKEERDIKQERFPREETGNTDLQHKSSDNGMNTNSGLKNLFTNNVSRCHNVEKRITKRGKRIPPELSLFQHKFKMDNFKKSTKIVRQNKSLDNKDGKYGCGNCNERYSAICDLENHIKLIHVESSVWKCTKCNDLFLQPLQLEEHICDKYEKNEKIYKIYSTFQCNVCNNVFSQKGDLKRHMKYHMQIST